MWGLWASAIGLRFVVIATSGPLPSGFHAPPGWRTLPASAFVHDGAMRLSLVATALVLACATAVLAGGSAGTAGSGGSPGCRSP